MPDTPKGVYISGGQPVERVSLGKGYAVGRLLGIMDNKRLKAPKSPIWPELRKELMAFELTATSMHDRYGASPGQHDDLITALALCVQADPPRTASIMPYQGVHVGEQPAAGRVWIPDRRNRSIHARCSVQLEGSALPAIRRTIAALQHLGWPYTSHCGPVPTPSPPRMSRSRLLESSPSSPTSVCKRSATR